MATLRIRLLGDFTLTGDDTPVTGMSAARLQALLAYLLLHRGVSQSRERVAFLFWADSTEAQALNNLRKALHHLRQHLPHAHQFIHSDAKSVVWLADSPFNLDVQDFEHLLTEAHNAAERNDFVATQAHLASAIGLYGGDLLPGCYEDWLITERERLRDTFTSALSQLIALLEGQKDYAKAIQLANRRLRLDPLSEAAYRDLMRLHVLNADHSSALRVYHACATTLQSELGVSPNTLTQQAYEQLLNQSQPAVVPQVAFPISTKLVGRESEWKRLNDVWKAATSGQPHCLIIVGEAGMGKSRLLEDFQTWANQYDIPTAYTRAYAAEGLLAFAPVAAWLRTDAFQSHWKRLDEVWLKELTRVLPELLTEMPHLPAPQPLTDGWQRKQLFEALARAMLVSHKPMLLLLDDLQWCDRETLEWLHYLLRFNVKAPLLVLGTLRSGEVMLDDQPDHPLAALLLDLRARQHITEIELMPLDRAETIKLATLTAERSLPDALAQRIFDDSEGNPLFVVELVRAYLAMEIKGGADPLPHSADPRMPLPPKVHALIRARIAHLSSSATRIAEAAATLGHDFMADVLSLVCRAEVKPDEFVRGLDELWQRRIVRDRSTDAYDFSHDRIRDVVLASISPARRRLLHRRVAQALEQMYAANLSSVCGRLARHYDEAGAPAEAIPYYFQAAQVAHDRFALEDQIGLLKRGLKAISLLPATATVVEREQQRLSFLLEMVMSLVQVRPGGDPELAQVSAEARGLSQNLGQDASLFKAQRGLWIHHLLKGELLAAREFAMHNMAVAQRIGTQPALGEAARALAMAEWFLGDFASAHQHIEQAIAHMPPEFLLTYSGVFDDSVSTDGMNAGAVILWQMGYPDQAMQQSVAGLTFSRALKLPFAVVMALEFVAHVYYALKNPRDVLNAAIEMQSLAEEYAFSQYIPIGQMLRGWAVAALGQPVEGAALIQRGIAGCQKDGASSMLTLYAALLAEAQLWAGQSDKAQITLHDALALADRNSERFWEAELHRLMGDCLLASNASQDASPDLALACYQKALEISRQQGTHSFELRAATSQARLLQNLGQQGEAYKLLSHSYAWFSEGFATADLQESRILLDELAGNDFGTPTG